MIVIMLSGYAGAGKDTAYKLIRKYYSNAIRFAFADELKKIALALTWDGKKDEKGRKFLQDLGQVARAYDENVWANIIANKINKRCFNNNIAIITDFRFHNEANIIKNKFNNVVTVRITGRKSDLGKNSNDTSEHDLDCYNFDYYISNTGTKQEFEDKLLHVMNELRF